MKERIVKKKSKLLQLFNKCIYYLIIFIIYKGKIITNKYFTLLQFINYFIIFILFITYILGEDYMV